MHEITNEYAIIFNGVTEILQEMEVLTRKMKMYQQLAEEAYMAAETTETVEEITV